MLFFECFFNYLYLTADSLINDLNKCLAHAHLIFVKKKKVMFLTLKIYTLTVQWKNPKYKK